MKKRADQNFAQESAPLPHATGAGQIPFTCKVLLVVALGVAWMTSLATHNIAYAQDEAPNRDRGILVASVHEGSPAAEAGVVRGDILMAVNGEAVDLTAELLQLLGGLDAESEVELTVLHGDELRTLRAQLESSGQGGYLGIVPCCDGPSAGAVWLGEGPRMAPNVLLPGGAQEFIIRPRVAGATVMEVMPESPAAEAGLQAGDHIVAVDEQPIDNEHSLAAVIASFAPGDEITLEVRRGGMAVQLQQELEWAEATADGAEDAKEKVTEEEVAEEEVEKITPQTPAEEAAADEAGATEEVTSTVKLETETLVVTLGENPDAPGSAYLGVRYADAANRLRFVGEPFAEGGSIFPPVDGHPFGNGPFYGRPPQRFHFFQGVPNPRHIPNADAEISALIVSVAPNSPAAEAGLQAGEIIVALNGEPLDDPNLLRAEISQLSPGDEIVLTVRQPAGDDAGKANAPEQNDTEKDDPKEGDTEENVDSQREVTVTLGENEDGGAWLGVQIGLSIRLEQMNVTE